MEAAFRNGALTVRGIRDIKDSVTPDLTFHLVPDEGFAADATEPYVPAAFAADGFIHCTDGAEEVARTANRYYRTDARPFVALVIDVQRVTAPVRYEDNARIYPHIYGALNRDAIVAVVAMPRAEDGTFLRPHLVGRR